MDLAWAERRSVGKAGRGMDSVVAMLRVVVGRAQGERKLSSAN
jgi:hypothetical protein